MSNKDINKQDFLKNNTEVDSFKKDNLHLFSFSLLKSKSKITLSQTYNSFKVDFSKDSYEPKNAKNKENRDIINNRKISLIEGDNNSSLKTLNIEVPSPQKLSNEKFKNDFMNEYDNSFANYAGINKKQFTDIYINNRYIPILDEFGDINISIKYIDDLLKTYSKNIKAGKKVLKRNRFKKIFKTQRKLLSEKFKKNRLFFEVKKNEGNKEININEPIRNINVIKKIEIKTLQQIDNSKIDKEIYTNKEIYNDNNNHNSRHQLNDIKKKIPNISIPKGNQNNEQKKLSTSHNNISSSYFTYKKSNINNGNTFNLYPLNNDTAKKNNINNNAASSSFGLYPFSIPLSESKQNTPSNCKAFIFPSLINLNNGNPIQTPANINYSNNTINNNNGINNNNVKSPIISPIISPLFYPYFQYINSSPKSPFICEYINQEKFTYNNLYPKSYFFPNNNSTLINNNNININSNIMNNNINNKK